VFLIRAGRSYRAEGDKKFVASGKYSNISETAEEPLWFQIKRNCGKIYFSGHPVSSEPGYKMIVIACNTASACSLDQVKNSFDIPIVEVVGPGAATAVRETVNKKVGVIGTVATVSSGVYEKAILKLDPEIEIYQKACPLFVPLVEEGWWENDIALRLQRNIFCR